MGSNDLQVFVVSDEAYKPDMYHTSFLVTNGSIPLAVDNGVTSTAPLAENYGYVFFGIVSVLVAVVMIWYIIKKRNRS